MKLTKHFFVTILMAFTSLGVFAQNAIQLEDVVGISGAMERRISIEGEPLQLVRQAQQLFSLHGGFRMDSSRPQFVFRFVKSGENSLLLTISSAGEELWKKQFSGSSLMDSLYEASDAAVSRTLGLPGFFDSTVVFISDRTGQAEVYKSDLLFASSQQLTKDRSQCLSPTISPDKSTILYTSFHGTGFPDIYKIDLRTLKRTTFAGFQGTNSGANFSPDGRQVAMILSSSGNSELYLSNTEGRDLKRLTRTSSLEADPTSSADGNRLALTSDQMGKPQIYTIDRAGRNFQRVRTDISRNCSEPTWNPQDPDLLAFTAAMGGEFEVALFSFKTGKSTVITRGVGDGVHPVWLRDGRHLIYTERTSKYTRLMIIDTLSGRHSVLSPSGMKNAREASVAY